MILYHWGCQAAERLEPDLCFSSGDMGPGFYLTDDLVQARVLARQAAHKAACLGQTPADLRGVVTAFDWLDDRTLDVLYIPPFTVPWLRMMSAGRAGQPLPADHDILLSKLPDEDMDRIINVNMIGALDPWEQHDDQKLAQSIQNLLPPRTLPDLYCFTSERALATLKPVVREPSRTTANAKEHLAGEALRMAVEQLSEKRGIPAEQALILLISSPVYDALYDLDTGMWTQGPARLLEAFEALET